MNRLREYLRDLKLSKYDRADIFGTVIAFGISCLLVAVSDLVGVALPLGWRTSVACIGVGCALYGVIRLHHAATGRRPLKDDGTVMSLFEYNDADMHRPKE